MKSFADFFTINGKPMFAPDQELSMSFEDWDSSDSGRDESGVMHRIVVRYKVGTWTFEYFSITEEEKQYMERLFPDSESFEFSHPDRVDSSKQVVSVAYRSKYSISWKNKRTGEWKNYKFNIIEC